MALSIHKNRIFAICVAAAAAFALSACDDQSTAQREDTTAPQVDQQLGELPSAIPEPVPAEPTDN